MPSQFFPPRPDIQPKIYAYRILNAADREGLLKVGYTTRDVKERVKKQLQTSGLKYEIVLAESALRSDGTAFTDHDVHKALQQAGLTRVDGEWFACTPEKVKAAVVAVRERKGFIPERTQTFAMRPEQRTAVEKTAAYFRTMLEEQPEKPPHFLWNAKMRFGKTFASYQLAKKMGWKKVLVLTFKPAVQNSWEEDLKTHVDFEGWQFISPGGLSYEETDKTKPIVCFGSFQDYLGRNRSTGGIKTKNEWVHAINWDLVVLDEYHYGAWRENAKELFEAEDKKEAAFGHGEGLQDFDEDIMPITTNAYLYLSGTPFRAIASGEFIEEQIFNWTYSDEQAAKANWPGENNPYAPNEAVELTFDLDYADGLGRADTSLYIFQPHFAYGDPLIDPPQGWIIDSTVPGYANIEDDMRTLVPQIIDQPKDKITLMLEMLVRAYDPCISCSVHFLNVEFV